MATENHPRIDRILRRAVDSPEECVDDLPAILAALEHDDRRIRIGAAWAICSVASERVDLASTLRAELDDRSGAAAVLAAQWIDSELRAESARDAASVDSDGRASPVAEAPSGSTPGASPPSAADTDVSASSGSDGPSTGDASTSESSTVATKNSSGSSDGDSSEGHSSNRDSTDTDSGGATSTIRPEVADAVVEDGRFTIELERTAFESLDVVDRIETDGHAWTYVALATIDARQRAVLVRSYRTPTGARPSTFRSAFETVLERWSGIHDHDNVLTVYDYGRMPNPWAVLDHAPDTLRSTGRLSVVDALDLVGDAAAGLAHAHERGVVHGSIDPRSLVIAGDDDGRVGLLSNVGVIDAFRAVDGPLPMDSRFGAPELFDDDYGAVDRLTDVYQLGAVFYTAVTGRPPHTESLVDLGGPADRSVDPPSSVLGDVPAVVDRIVETAMATHKIARYESADDFAVALRSASESVRGDR